MFQMGAQTQLLNSHEIARGVYFLRPSPAPEGLNHKEQKRQRHFQEASTTLKEETLLLSMENDGIANLSRELFWIP